MILRLDGGLRGSWSELIDADIIIPIKLYPDKARSVKVEGGNEEYGRLRDVGIYGFGCVGKKAI